MRTLVLGEGVADERGRVNVVSELLPATLPDVVEVCESFETEHSEEPCFPEEEVAIASAATSVLLPASRDTRRRA